MALTEHDHVVEQLAAQSPDEALGVPVLPRRSRGDDELLDAQVSHARIERRPVDAVAVSDQSHRSRPAKEDAGLSIIGATPRLSLS